MVPRPGKAPQSCDKSEVHSVRVIRWRDVSKEYRTPTIGVIVAMEEEIAVLRDRYFAAGQVDGSRARQFLARTPSANVVLCQSGIGKVNAALAAAEVIARFDPHILIVSGLAGSLRSDLIAGDVVVSSGAAHHDFDLRPLLGGRGILPGMSSATFSATDELIDAARSSCQRALDAREALGFGRHELLVGTVASGDALVASSARKAEITSTLPEAICVDMETAAIAQVAHITGRDWVSIRIISDAADESFDVKDVLGFARDEGSAMIASLVQELSGLGSF